MLSPIQAGVAMSTLYARNTVFRMRSLLIVALVGIDMLAALAFRANADSDEALAAAEPTLGESVTPAARVRELESDLRRMGPINPLALQEYEALKERHDFVAEQLEDVRSGRRELNKVITAVDAEIVDVFEAAFVDVADNFKQIFSTTCYKYVYRQSLCVYAVPMASCVEQTLSLLVEMATWV